MVPGELIPSTMAVFNLERAIGPLKFRGMHYLYMAGPVGHNNNSDSVVTIWHDFEETSAIFHRLLEFSLIIIAEVLNGFLMKH